ncbi:MAG: hypothetical protein KKC19_04480 [Nanoarchaeota archaeon]|nr:hypothetical protein [Nanoarchaeota archaeon]
MMINYQYSYLVWTLIFATAWLGLYLWRKDTRKEMIIISTLFGIGGVLSQIVYLNDWWRPETITQTSIGIEDFLIGFFIGGLAAVIYEEVYKKRIKIKEKTNKKRGSTFYIFPIFIIIFFGSFYILKINSFYSTIMAFLISTGIIWIKRKDLIKNSIISGILTMIVGVAIYFILLAIYPELIERFWYLEKGSWYRELFFGLPIEEYLFYLFAGAFIGPLYEYWKEGKLINIKS